MQQQKKRKSQLIHCYNNKNIGKFIALLYKNKGKYLKLVNIYNTCSSCLLLGEHLAHDDTVNNRQQREKQNPSNSNTSMVQRVTVVEPNLSCHKTRFGLFFYFYFSFFFIMTFFYLIAAVSYGLFWFHFDFGFEYV